MKFTIAITGKGRHLDPSPRRLQRPPARTTGSKTFEEESVLNKFEFEPGSEEEDISEPDGTLEDDDIEAANDTNETETTNLEGPAVVSEGTRANDTVDEADALALFSLIVKRAIEEDEEEAINDSNEGKSETESVDEDTFSISDLPKLFKPLIDAFSDASGSEAPKKADFLSWFPSLKDLFKPSKPSETEATNSAAQPGRRSSLPVISDPSLQVPPASAQLPEPEILPSSPPHYMTNIVPTVTVPPVTVTKPKIPTYKPPITINSPDDSNSDEDLETDF
uniref:Uncharacterized protein n=1 Tax=Sphaerodactylus townsendi TaxID=933632 RepID=A0ACB8EGB0_9SAUR